MARMLSIPVNIVKQALPITVLSPFIPLGLRALKNPQYVGGDTDLLKLVITCHDIDTGTFSRIIA
jgi:hypothetical protein